MSTVLPGVHATDDARAAVELSADELAALTAGDPEAASGFARAGEHDPAAPPPEDEADGGAPPAQTKPAPAAAAPAKAKPARVLSAEVLPDATALSLAGTVFPGREFKDADAARQALQGTLAGNAGRARKLSDTEAELEKVRLENETLKARAAAAAPPATGAGKGAAAPAAPAAAADEISPDEQEALEFTRSLGTARWEQLDRWFDGDGLPEGFKPEAGRRMALAGLARDLVKFTGKKRAAERAALREEIVAELTGKIEPRLKRAEVPVQQHEERIEAAKLFYGFATRNVDDETGEDLFPELTSGDIKAATEIARIWTKNGSKRTDEAIENAVWRFRRENPDWVPPAEASADAEDEESPSTDAADTAQPAPRRRSHRGAISGTGVPGLGLPPRSGAQPADGLGEVTPAQRAHEKEARELGLSPTRLRRSA